MRRVAYTACALVCLSGTLASAREAPRPVDVEVSRAERGAHVVSLSLAQGYALNTRVPKDRRLRLEVGDRTWTTGSFTRAPGHARVEIEARGARQGLLTAYLCRPDRCTRVRQTLSF